MKTVIQRIFKESKITFISSIVSCVLMIIFTLSLKYSSFKWMNEFEIQVYGNLRVFMYNLSLYVISFFLSISVLRRSMSYGKAVQFLTSVIPIYFFYKILAMFLDAFEGRNETWVISSIVIGASVLLVVTAIALDRIYTTLIQENKLFKSFLDRTSLTITKQRANQLKLMNAQRYQKSTTAQIMDIIKGGALHLESDEGTVKSQIVLNEARIEALGHFLDQMQDLNEDSEKDMKEMEILLSRFAKDFNDTDEILGPKF